MSGENSESASRSATVTGAGGGRDVFAGSHMVAFVVATVASALFVLEACLRREATTGTAADREVLAWMVAHRHPWLNTAAIVITNAGSPVAVAVVGAAVGLLLWWHTRQLWVAVAVMATPALAGLVSTTTKVLVGVHRPPSSVQLLSETDASFPSGHVAGTLALLGIVAVLLGTGRSTRVRAALGGIVAAIVVLVAVTRLYLGVHWLTDVVGGALLGCVAVVAVSLCLSWHTRSVRGN